MDKQIVVQAWLWRGVEHFYLAFILEEERWRHYQPLFDYMGLEMFCKAYILAERASEYESLNDQASKHKIDKIAKSCGHNLREMLEKINNSIGTNKIVHLLSANYDSDDFTGNQIVDVLEAAYIETRYPVSKSISKKFPIKGTNLCWYPLLFSGLSKFAYAVSRGILYSLKSNFNVSVKKIDIDKSILIEESGVRFCRLFFNDDIERYTI